MVDIVSFPPEPETAPDLSIVLRGQSYPLTCRHALPSPDIPTETDTPTTQLQKRLLSQLSFPALHPESFRRSSEIVRAFCSDMVLLETMAAQWRRFLTQLRKANLKTVVDEKIPKRQQQQALNQALQAMGHESAVMVDDGGVLNGDLVEQPPLHVFQTLQRTLRTVLSGFIHAMQSDLDQLSDLRVVGLLEWFGDRTCRFHFYEHRLTSVVEFQKTERQQVPMTRHGKTRLGMEVIESLAGRHVHSVTRRTELLIEAKSCSAGDPQLVLPKAVRECITHCPAWLRPELQVVEGEKVREEWVELVRVEHQWQERWCRKRIQPHFDPALTLFGQYVLMGWDEQAHQAEIRSRIRQGSDQLWQPQPSSAPAQPNRLRTQMVAWLAAIVFGMLVLLSTGQDAGHVCAILVPLASLPVTYRCLTGGRSIVEIEALQPPSFMAALSMMFSVLSAGFLLAAVLFGEPKLLLTFLIGVSGAALFEVFRRQSKGGVA